MQSLKPLFSDSNYENTFCNVQKCLRLNDLDEIGDSTHYLIFHMLGMFSFRQLTVEKTIKFWLDFLSDFNLYPTHVTIHPDKIKDWSSYYPKELDIRPDSECKWSDGNIGGYCTEFYYNEVEIGNIVNPLGNCIDVGFGLERLLNLKYGNSIISKNEILTDTVIQLIEEGFTPSSSKQGYVLRKLLNMMVFEGIKIDHQFYEKIYNDQVNIYKNYLKNKDHKKYKDKNEFWWLDTFGMDVKNILKYKVLKI